MSSTTYPASQQAMRQLARITTIAIAGIAYFTVVIIALHFLRADSDPVAQTTSHYAVGSYGYLMTSAFLGVSLASLALIVGLYHGVVPLARSRSGLALLGVWAAGVLIVMFFPIDAADAPRTTSGIIHRISGPLAFLSLGTGAILVSWRLKYDERWRPLRHVVLPLAACILTAFIVTGLNIAIDSGFQGLFQRIVLLMFVTWFTLMAMHMHSVAHQSEQ